MIPRKKRLMARNGGGRSGGSVFSLPPGRPVGSATGEGRCNVCNISVLW